MSQETHTGYTYIPNLAGQLPEIPSDSIISQTFYKGERLRAILFGFAPGQELSEHTASKPATLHFLQGQARLTLGKDEMRAQPGTWVHMPPNLSHSVHAETAVLMLLEMIED
ncbi:MAG: cupin domain-containing protein [Anaerolineales bacterium]|nr:cupin domain-containing protein [Anaerolineales bacterium]